MYPIHHFIFTILMSGFLLPILGWKIVLFWLGSFFIDVDHYWWYIIKFKKFSLKDAIQYGKDNLTDFKLHILHTFEFWFLMVIWSLYSEFAFIILLGLIFHNVMDYLDMVAQGKAYHRSFSFTGWLIHSPSNSTKV